ncbi:cytochrome P450 [Aspergillus homomorphus CBS 101889]|uniref:Cytochrome P450 n=1 Tax=Aspergillus homomorphus (strain CBS 101889) TaxID=1450537 RepID=A0A395I0N9_ASPHC|nr:cytochrome P450 [Aspergillus homomorphus CBS 101889]RAL13285.1 cytochrome P450 [Aspergillus homomorphus CBS 101889]
MILAIGLATLIADWHDQYGPIICVRFGSLKIIFLGSYEVVHELLEKRGSNYSSRPQFLADRVSNGLLPTFLPYAEKWKAHHRLHSSLLTLQASQQYQALQEVESLQLVWELLEPHADFAARFQRYASSQIFALAYGKRMPRGDEEQVRELDEIMAGILQGINLGNEVFPVLKYLPRPPSPDHPTSLLSTADLWYNIGALYEAGTDSTAILLEVFMLAMVLHPIAQRRAQHELDTVLGTTPRLPALTDLSSLPYTRALISELLRWRHPSPGGLHHATTAADFYRGFHIPGDTAVVANHFSADTDPALFPDPLAFEPERWLRNPGLPVSAFGFGRRACPGRYLGWNSVAIAVARLLWVYEIVPQRDRLGREVVPDPWDLTQGIGVRPRCVRARVRVRGGCIGVGERRGIVERAWEGLGGDVDLRELLGV